ncbi:MAG TPA: ribosome rescue GTPase HflX [Steroidobacteraceae bacterium]|nr:ribosome rescue GTPase HflX [Steroidobacteraceae bacterium]
MGGTLQLFERPRGGERAVLVGVGIGHPVDPTDIAEFAALAASAGTVGLGTVLAARARPDPKYFVGSGKAEEIRAFAEAHHADLVLVDQTLTPSQERNLEKLTGRRVLDRNGLILDIFAQRARSFEGKLQVELAQLSHLATRLVRGWTHLERQKGGIGLRGPGETQLETDRRLIAKRIRTLRSRLEKLDRQRDTGRHVRREVPVPTVALVGYTNAGKSTLFNTLTGADTYVANQLFATLDPTVRRIELAGIGEVVLADTVGFVRALPHELIAAFRSTLQEARDADLLLHVVDASDPLRDERMEQVREVLRGIGAGEIRELVVFNKIDLSHDAPRTILGSDGAPTQAWVSAVTGAGLESLCESLAQAVRPNQVRRTLHLDLKAAAVRSELYKRNAVRAERQCEDGSWEMDVELDLTEVAKLLGAKGVNLGSTPRAREQRVA